MSSNVEWLGFRVGFLKCVFTRYGKVNFRRNTGCISRKFNAVTVICAEMVQALHNLLGGDEFSAIFYKIKSVLTRWYNYY